MSSQTIDGVSRDLLERLVRFAGGKARQELCDLLDANPVHIDYASLDPVQRLAVCRGEPIPPSEDS